MAADEGRLLGAVLAALDGAVSRMHDGNLSAAGRR
jgi:hypothetical protein